MAQVKIYGLRDHLNRNRERISEAVHASLVSALEIPEEKKFQRFIALDPIDFVYPPDRSRSYTILEISLFQGRSSNAKRHLIMDLFSRLEHKAGISPQDLEITIFETPRENWGIRGMPGDDLALNYKVEV